MKLRSLVLGFVLLSTPAQALASTTPNPVTDWARIVQPAIQLQEPGKPARPAGSAEVLHTMVVLAMYDAMMAIEGGYEPYAIAIPSSPGADARAAVATAAYVTAHARVSPAQVAYLDEQYLTYMTDISDGPAKTDGVAVGAAAASAILTLRANDGMANLVLYQCSVVPPAPGEFEPDTGCPTGPGAPQPADVKLGRVQPFTFTDPSRFRPDGPEPMTSKDYAADFAETRDYGRIDSTVRTPEQTDVAYFWAEHPYVHWNRNLIRLATDRDLGARETARFFAMVHTAAADATIAGFEAKYHFVAWRPRTAIPRADTDGNPDTVADPTWKPLLSVNHPEYPSGHGFWSTALLEAAADYFGTDKITWTITTSKAAVPQLVRTERTYGSLKAIARQIDDARVWAGLHWRHSMRHGDQIGRHVAKHVTRSFFEPAKR